ncbi:MAG: FkbM family methyltransferase [Pseudomonadota bacterium]
MKFKIIVDICSNLLISVQPLRLFSQKTVERSQGFIYDSYNLVDEAALAISLLPAKGAIVIDGGANAGHWSQSMLTQASGQRIKKLLMIEPNQFHRSTHHSIQEKFSGIVQTDWVALGVKSAVMELHFDTDDSGLASLYNRQINHHGIKLDKSESVNVEPLTNLVSRHEFDRIDFLKLDLEGHELEALKGAEPLLINHTIRAMQFEFGGANIDSRTYLRDFWELLHEKHGYTLYRLIPNRKLIKIEKYSESLERFT